MRADAGAGVVAGDQSLVGVVRREAGELRGARAPRQQEPGDGRGAFHARLAEVVTPAERDGLAIAGPAMELERLERQSFDRRQQIRFFRSADEFFAKAESRRLRLEQAVLRRKSGNACGHQFTSVNRYWSRMYWLKYSPLEKARRIPS